MFAGYVPNTAWFGNKIELDAHGYVITDTDHRTNLPGVYAAGDLCVKNLRQVVTAVSDGAAAATSLEKYVSLLHEKLELPEFAMKKSDTSRLGGAREGHAPEAENSSNRFFTSEIKNQLAAVFSRFKSRVIVKAWLDDSALAGEMGSFIGELEELTDRVQVVRAPRAETEARRKSGKLTPSLEILREC